MNRVKTSHVAWSYAAFTIKETCDIVFPKYTLGYLNKNVSLNAPPVTLHNITLLPKFRSQLNWACSICSKQVVEYYNRGRKHFHFLTKKSFLGR